MEKPGQLKQISYFPALTGVRALAAFMVFIHHYLPNDNLSHSKKLITFVQEFHVGVTLFFVLSGFLIAYRYLEPGKINFKKYLVNRFAKIYPMYFILITVTILYYYFFQYQKEASYFTVYVFSITLIKGFSEIMLNTGIPQGWSLTVEEVFYFCAPFFFFLIRKNKHWLYLLPLLILILGFVIVHLCKPNPNYEFMNSNDFMLNYTFFGRCTEFFAGIALALLIKNPDFKIKGRGFTYIGVLAILYSIYLISTFRNGDSSGVMHPMGKLINNFLLPVFGITTFYYGLIKEKTVLSALLSSKLFQILGKSSYVFYLIHVGIFTQWINKITESYILGFIYLTLIAYFLYAFIEKPLDAFIRKKFTSVPVKVES